MDTLVTLVTVLGLLLVVEGIPWFLSPSRVKSFLRQLMGLDDSMLRLWGLGAMLAGLLLVWLVRG